MLLIGMILLYLFLGIVVGYVAVRLRRAIEGAPEGRRSISWSTACLLPGIVFVILTIFLNFINL
jgi:H+/Cl- antiporter ClcA